MERQWLTLDQIKAEYASNDYNPELLLQHLLHHVEASSASVPAGWKLVPAEILDRFQELNPSNYDHDDVCALNAWAVELVLAAAPTPPVSEDRKDTERFRDGWAHSCNALCMEIELWIARCPHCGRPAPKAPTSKGWDKP